MFVSSQPRSALAPFFRRLTAVAGVALVLFLGASAASPGLHQHLHGDHAAETGADYCAVVLFASGITAALAAVFVAAPRVSWATPLPPIVRRIFVVAPRYLRQPERGPPIR